MIFLIARFNLGPDKKIIQKNDQLLVSADKKWPLGLKDIKE